MNEKLVSNSIFHKVQHQYVPKVNYSKHPPNFENLREFPSCRVSYPFPIYTASIPLSKIDICHRKTKEVYDYKFQLKVCHSTYRQAIKKKTLRQHKRKNIYPMSAFRFCELLESHPDPYFSGTYDWYFTGGNLKVLNSEGNNNLIVHAGGKKLQNLNVSTLSKKGRYGYKLEKTTTNTTNSEIYEIQSVSGENECKIFARHRQKISIFSSENHNENFVKKCEIKTREKVPFISLTQDESYLNLLVTSDLTKTVCIWDYEKTQRKPKQTLYSQSMEMITNCLKDDESNPNCDQKDEMWNCLKSCGRDTFILAGLYDFHILDSRACYEKKSSIVSSLNFKENLLEPCERISSISLSKISENLVYFGTKHKLLAIDIRYISEKLNSTKSLVHCWTHQMDMSPLLLKTIHYPNNINDEMIVMSSPINGDTRLCENSLRSPNKENEFSSLCMPYKPHDLREALENIQNRGQCLHPIANLGARIKSCTTGLDIVDFSNNKNVIHTLSANSLGDIFMQEIFCSLDTDEETKIDKRMDNEIISKFEEWEREIKANLLCRKDNNLNVTNVENLAPMRNVLLSNLLSVESEEFETPKKQLRMQRWQKPIHSLSKYKDALATDLLSIWDIDVIQSTAGSSFNLNLSEEKKSRKEIKKDSKVLNWLTSAVDINPLNAGDPLKDINEHDDEQIAYLQTDDKEVIPSSNTTILHQAGVHMLLDSTMEDSFQMASPMDGVTSTKNLKPAQKGKKYVMGF